jgi:excinuclease ABC subunit C
MIKIEKLNNLNLEEQSKRLPQKPGVYLFKDNSDHIFYIGKAKNLKNRVRSYFQKKDSDWKIASIIESSTKIDYIETQNELAAMLLEAELIQANQPKFNILLKSGQPFIYLLITSPLKKLPELKITRNKKEKGTYFGPFLEKTPARKVYDFLIKTFRLKLCKKKIENGCLDYHLGICAGSCRPDFDKNSYLQRLELAKMALKQGHKNFLQYLKTKIEEHNKKLEFEKSKELNDFYQAFQTVFESLDTSTPAKTLVTKDIWILTPDKKNLFLFSEKNAAIKKKYLFYLPLEQDQNQYLEYFKSYYRSFICPNTILVNFDIDKSEKELLGSFLQKWHKRETVSIIHPDSGHFLNLVNLAAIHAEQELRKQKNVTAALKNLLLLPVEPHTIDCFDISHKQGMFMVGSCIRFLDGQPDKKNFRHFKIKTVDFQNDYACLQEIVTRRYKDSKELPDLILIDGGKGQLSAITKILPEAEVASLAKKEETIFSKRIPHGKKLNLQNYAAQILIALRDYAHHFAISYHRKIVKI